MSYGWWLLLPGPMVLTQMCGGSLLFLQTHQLHSETSAAFCAVKVLKIKMAFGISFFPRAEVFLFVWFLTRPLVLQEFFQVSLCCPAAMELWVLLFNG